MFSSSLRVLVDGVRVAAIPTLQQSVSPYADLILGPPSTPVVAVVSLNHRFRNWLPH